MNGKERVMDSREKARIYLSVDRIAEYRQSDIDSLTCLLDKCVEEAEAKQRRRCADKAYEALVAENGRYPCGTYFIIQKACLNATRENK